MSAVIDAVEYALPSRIETAEDVAADHPHWQMQKIARKTGIQQRYLADEHEWASDLGIAAAQKLLARTGTSANAIDYLLFTTQSPDYMLPTTACLIQERLGLPTHIGALDINLGCSGYIYALGIAKALMETGQSQRLLLITADTYSKMVNPGDRSVRALFGDGASATLLSHRESMTESAIGPFVYGTDGSGAGNLIAPNSGMRRAAWRHQAQEYRDRHGNTRSDNDLYMNGRAIVEFTMKEIPAAIQQVCDKAGLSLADIDAVVPHQASAMVLDNIRRQLDLPKNRFIVDMKYLGNTVSSSIPMAIQRAVTQGHISPGARLLLVGFGVGLSWGATIVRLPADFAGSEYAPS